MRGDLTVVHRVLERELKYFSPLWHRMIVLHSKLRLNTERTTKQYEEIRQLWKLSNFNWFVCDNLWLLSRILMAVAVEEKK